MARKKGVNNKKSVGQYIAFDSSAGKKIVASGSNPGTVIKKARGQGVEVPAIVFVPKKDTTFLY